MELDDQSNVIAMPRGGVAKRCVARTDSGRGPRCKKVAVEGSSVCRTHGGGAPQVQRKAIVRRELKQWGLDVDTLADPGETLLQLMTQSKMRAAFYSELLRQSYEAADQNGNQSEFEMPNGIKGLIDKKYIQGENGTIYVGDAIKSIVVLEGLERDRCAKLAIEALRAGLAERQMRIIETQAQALTAAVQASLDRAGVVGPARLEALDVASAVLLEWSQTTA